MWFVSLELAAQLAVLLACVCIIRSIYYEIIRKLYHLPPGPIGVPFLGNLLSAANLVNFGTDLYNNYGNVTMIYFGSQRYVHLHTIDVITDVFKKQNVINRSLGKGVHLQHIQPAQQSIAVSGTKYWSPKRKRFQSVTSSLINNSLYLNRSFNYSFNDHVINSIDDCIDNEKLWYPAADVAYLHFNSVWSAVFQCDLSFDDKDRSELMQIMDDTIKQMGRNVLAKSFGIFYKMIPQFMANRMFNAFRELTEFIEKSIYKYCKAENGKLYDRAVFDMNNTEWNQHFDDALKSRDVSFVTKLIAVHRANPVEDSTKAAILGEIGTLLEAGIDSTMRASEYCLILLAKSPQIQETIYNEIVAVFGDDWRMETISAFKLNAVHFLRAFLFEALRISSIVAIGVPHTNDKGIWVKNAVDNNGNLYDCFIPKGTEIIMNVVNANRNDKYWLNKTNHKPMAVHLNLWLDKNNKFKMNANKDKMMSFGIGKRDCAGASLAKRSLLVLLAKFILMYKFSVEDPNLEIKQRFDFGFSVDPQIPIKVQKR